MRQVISTGGIEITDFCNLNCVHCYIENDKKQKCFMSYEQIFYLIEEFVKHRASVVTITGGEPFLHPDIESIIHKIGTKFSTTKFYITTNATLLNDNLIHIIELYKNIIIQVSLDGANKETHESQHGVNTYDKVICALEKMMNIPYTRKIIRMTISKLNYKECVQVADIANKYNSRSSFVYICNVGNASQNWRMLEMNLAQKIYVNEVLLRYSEKYPTRYVYPPTSVQSCSFIEDKGVLGLTIHTNGDVDICSCLDNNYIVGNAFVDNFDVILNSSKIDLLYSKVKERIKVVRSRDCEGCSALVRCHQGCLGRAQMKGNDYGQDGECEYRRALLFKNLFRYDFNLKGIDDG